MPIAGARFPNALGGTVQLLVAVLAGNLRVQNTTWTAIRHPTATSAGRITRRSLRYKMMTAEHQPGKRQTQKIQHRHQRLRTRLKRRTRKALDFREIVGV
jgi:hypothetical protein